jgi:hypothetical protein
VLAPIEVPASADRYRVVLRGNYDNVKSRGSAAAGTATITLDAAAAPFPTFMPGERIAIESALLGIAEVRTITAFTAATGQIAVDANLVNDYEAGSPVNQISEFTYRLDNQNVLWRDGTIVADQMDILQLQYVLADATLVADPAGLMEQLRAADIRMHAERPEHSGLTPEAELDTEVRIRNLGIVAEPEVGT